VKRLTALMAGTALLAACGGDASGPSRTDLAGTYELTTLSFDPQGVLPEVDLLDRLDVTGIQLTLADDGRAQLLYQEPGSGLVNIVEGSYSTPEIGARIHFTATAALNRLMIPARLTYTYDSGALTFDGEAPDGVDRQRLLQLVPEWSDEQLLSPVPGRITVRFERLLPSVLGAS
jgi:hypothetical protein